MKICILGAGNIGTAMLEGLDKDENEITVWNRSAGRLKKFELYENIKCTTDLIEALWDCDLALLCIDGSAIDSVAVEMAACFGDREPVVGSCAASVSLAELSEALATADGPHRRVFRLLPNIAATVGSSTNLYCSQGLTEEEDELITNLFKSVGSTFVIAEKDFPAAMALSSCGIAYIMRYIRATMLAGVQMGLTPDTAENLTICAMEGAIKLLDDPGTDDFNPELFIDRVCTPGGVTIRGLNAMEEAGFSSAIIKGLLATLKK